ncbi:MAG: PHP domain-containing protein [Candidatus Velthaea sp.]
MTVDFHCHTNESDGTLPPVDLVSSMRKRGVTVFSITDHDTMRAYDDITAEGLRLIPGIEINTTWHGNDVHILGYGLPLGPSALADTLEVNRGHRRARVEQMVAQLSAAGYPLTLEAVLAESGGGHALGRPHVAKALIRAGYVADVNDAFKKLLSRGGAGYVPSHHITPLEAIDIIASSGGVPVLAHPGRLKDESILDDLAESGLVGLEVFYPTHTTPMVSHFRKKATQYGLVMTAGSDFHDIRYNTRGVGMDIDEADIKPFLELVA